MSVGSGLSMFGGGDHIRNIGSCFINIFYIPIYVCVSLLLLWSLSIFNLIWSWDALKNSTADVYITRINKRFK